MKTCTVHKCCNPAIAKGLCGKHYQRFLRTGKTEVQSSRAINHRRFCAVWGCNEPARCRQMCQGHYKTYWRAAKELDMTLDDYIAKHVKLVKKPKFITDSVVNS